MRYIYIYSFLTAESEYFFEEFGKSSLITRKGGNLKFSKYPPLKNLNKLNQIG